MELLSQNYAHLPQHIELVVTSDADFDCAMTAMPEVLKGLVVPKQLTYGHLLQQRFTGIAKTWNLLTGKLSSAPQWLAVLKPWRWLGLSFAAMCLLHVSLLGFDTWQLKKRHHALSVEMDSVFRQAIPSGHIVDHKKQLSQELKKVMGGGSGLRFMSKINRLGAVLAAHQVTNINTLNYEQDKNELRLDFLIKDYDALQQVISELKAQGLMAEIQNSNAQNDSLRVRLKIVG